MKAIQTIATKEIRSALHSVSTYIIFFLFLQVVGWYFALTAFKIGRADLRPIFNIIHLIFLFYIPALTMSSFAKEQAGGTLELLLTMPIKLKQIIWGKFIAYLVLLIIVVALTMVLMLTMVVFGTNIDWGAFMGGYLGLLVMGSAYIAIGLFASSLQSNQMLAFIISFFISLFFYIFQQIMPLLPMTLANICQFISFDYHYQSFLKGIIDTRDVIYFLSVIIVFTLFTEFKLRLHNQMQER